jgi:hypothetical protein
MMLLFFKKNLKFISLFFQIISTNKIRATIPLGQELGPFLEGEPGDL